MTKTVALMGYYGMSNFGDDLFCEVLWEAQQRHAPALRMVVVAPLAATFPGESLALPEWMRSRWSGIGWGSSAVRLFGRTKALVQADAIVWAGGSVFTENRGVRRLHDRLAMVGSRRQYAVGVSVGPFVSADQEQEVTRHLSRYARVMVRDRASVQRAHHLDGVSYCGDLGVLLDAPPTQPAQPLGYVGFAPCSSATPDFESLVPFIDRLCARFATSDFTGVRVLALNGHRARGDVDLAERAHQRIVAQGIRAELVVYGAGGARGVPEMAQAITSLRAMVTHRLHGAIVAYAAGVPFVLQEYHQKCTDFLDDVGQPPSLRAHAPDEVWSAVEALLSPQAPLPVVPPEGYKVRAGNGLLELLAEVSVR